MFEELKENVCNCRYCEEKFGFEPHPVFWGEENSLIVQISQAPSNNVHNSLKPFTDMSGKTLKYDWYQISDEEFYNTKNFFISALAHCYPGKDKNGNDRVPPKCCYEKWISKELEVINNRIYIINIAFIITFFVIYFLQLNFFSWFKIAGVMLCKRKLRRKTTFPYVPFLSVGAVIAIL